MTADARLAVAVALVFALASVLSALAVARRWLRASPWFAPRDGMTR